MNNLVVQEVVRKARAAGLDKPLAVWSEEADSVVILDTPAGERMLSIEVKEIREKVASRRIKCGVPCYGADGEPDIFFICVEVPLDYVNMEEDEDIHTMNHHFRAARHGTFLLTGQRLGHHTPVFDDTSGRWDSLLAVFQWDTASVINLDGTL